VHNLPKLDASIAGGTTLKPPDSTPRSKSASSTPRGKPPAKKKGGVPSHLQGESLLVSSRFADLCRDRKGASIAQPQMRGMSLEQLQHTYACAKALCKTEEWQSTDPSLAGKQLKPSEMTLYDLTHYLLVPATAARQCSFVELIAAEGQQGPDWFVSHWWGEPVAQFIDCLASHARDRCLPPHSSYWCARARCGREGGGRGARAGKRILP
jgi:hypothetical protein